MADQDRKFAPVRKVRPLKFNRRNMLKFANEIYNEKTGEYTRLCNGTLTNGRDPNDKLRVMHCGLGELQWRFNGCHAYRFAQHNIDYSSRNAPSVETVEKGEHNVVSDFSNRDIVSDQSTAYDILDSIPSVNDGSKSYKSRAKRVAAKIREFAKLITK